MAKDRPTILQIIPQLDAGGAELSTLEIADAIVRAGGRALVLAEPGRLTPKLNAVGAEPIPFPAATKNPLRMLANARAIARMVPAEGVDLIHARSRAPAWSGLLAARRARVPFVTTYHGAYRDTNALKRFYNSVMARGDVVIANSRYTADLIGSRHATPHRRMEVIHRGVAGVDFDPQEVAADRVARLQQRWGVDPKVPVILHAARLTRWKGQTVLLEAVARLQARDTSRDAVVVFAGDAQGRDSYVQELHAQIARLGLGDRVRLVGHVDDMPAAYLAARVAVVASTDPEAFGRTAVEAAAVGCPVIATNIGAPQETVLAQPVATKEEITGWLVPPGDPEALARALAEALDLSPTEQSRMGMRGRQHALANFTTEAMQRKTLAVYDRLLGTTLAARFERRSLHKHSVTESGGQS